MLYATHARVHLSAIAQNLRAVRERVGDRLVLAAVKANAYGHGAVAVSQMLQDTGAADWLGVATVPEVTELRAAGIEMPILKLSHVFPHELEAAVAARTTLVVVDEATLRAADEAARKASTTVDCHLKVDTGMRRIGTSPTTAPELARLAETLPGVRLTGLLTHLPVSDSPSQDDFTGNQVGLFAETARQVQEAVGRRLLVHAANSGAVLAHPEAWFDMVRPGIMVYGHYPDPATPRTVALQGAMTLATRVSLVKRVQPGETVGYGRTWRAERETTIATIPAGYADGLSRLLSNRGSALVRGRRYPIVGRVCMDQSMLDLGDDPVEPGDEVVLIGRQGGQEITMTEVADLMGTIPYEVSCVIPPRVTRVPEPVDA
ncbi:MAG: alanine racemase [Actinomycetia bacterium]|nr:alanine racemase [Actinomycetes bacterium]